MEVPDIIIILIYITTYILLIHYFPNFFSTTWLNYSTVYFVLFNNKFKNLLTVVNPHSFFP